MYEPSDFPTIRLRDLANRAERFAGEVVNELYQLNREQPRPWGMSEERFKALQEEYRGTLPGFDLQQVQRRLEEHFYEYIASRYLILPDETTPGEITG